MKDSNDLQTMDFVQSQTKRQGRPKTNPLSRPEQQAAAQKRYRLKVTGEQAKRKLQTYVEPESIARLEAIKKSHQFTNQGAVIDYLLKKAEE